VPPIEHSPARSGVRVLRRQQVLDKFKISASTLYSWIAAGRFPGPVAIGENTKVWLEDEIEALLIERAKERDRGQLDLVDVDQQAE
jgi:prophage regulatory protein